MKEITLVIGGCKSGKSRQALEIAESYGLRPLFLATCVPCDEEMATRVARHRQERGDAWEAIEVPLALPEAICDHAGQDRVLLVDCLTLWISNLLMRREEEAFVTARTERLAESLVAASCPVVLVSNEVGCGIVPENRLSRLFRDLSGLTNQRVAAVAHRVVRMTAGIAVRIKP
jgi:adenosylcobinamide kinase/adenosylcobinamide-phosphate guanylyltransferase